MVKTKQQGMDKESQQIDQKVQFIRDNGFVKGQYPGFDCLYDIFSWKAGYPVYIAGAPYHGKTQFLLECLVYKSMVFGEIHALFLGETGDEAEILIEIMYIYKMKSVVKNISKNEVNRYAMDDNEYFDALQWVKHHFHIILDFEPFTMWGFYAKVDALEKKLNIKFHTTSIDPVMHLDIPESYGTSEHMYLRSALKYCNNNSKEHKRINILVNHIADLPYLKQGDIRYYPKAFPNEWAGGRMWHRFAFTMLLVYKCPKGIRNENDEYYEENQTIIWNQKPKPKGTGKFAECNLFWDWKTNRYYEKDAMGEMVFAHEQPKVIKLPVQDKLPF